MRADSQQWLTQCALDDGRLNSFDVWVVYAGLGGLQDGLLVDGYLSGLMPMSHLDRDLVARAVNVLLEENGDFGPRAPLCAESAWLSGEAAFSSRYAGDVTAADLIAPLVGADRAEVLRLASLERTGLLRAGSEEEFDAVTAEAARRFPGCSASIALITADRQIIKSLVGAIGSDGPRAASFCHWTISGPGGFVVTDAQADPRVATHPLVTGAPGIRFYAGYPVRGPGGWRIGSLCVVADHPRDFSTVDALSLRELASTVQGLIGVQ